MTLADLKHVLDISVRRDDLTAEYSGWIAEALQNIQQAHSFAFMASAPLFTIPTGDTSIALGAGFKELQKAESPVNMQEGTDGRFVPCDVTNLELLYRKDSALLLPINFSRSLRRRYMPVYITGSGSTATLNLYDPASLPLTFKVFSYFFQPALANPTDSNTLTNTYTTLVKAKLKAIAFSEINDPLADAWEKKAEGELNKAIREDVYSRLAGRNLQMGG